MTQQILLSVVLPTRNEEKNIAPMMVALSTALLGVNHEVIFVDDSDDNTPQVIERLIQTYTNLRLIHRKGENRQGGLSTAVAKGFAEAQGKYVCVMDSDLQHPPQTVPLLLEKALDTEADVVIASRYRPGGSYQGLSGPVRKFVSISLKELARLVFWPHLKHITDPLGGFFLIKRSLLKSIELSPQGFKILLEVLIRTPWKTAQEVAYEFKVRKEGESKAKIKQGLSFFSHLARLVWTVPEVGRFWKFGLIGGSVAVFSLLFLYFLVDIVSIEKNLAYFIQAFTALQLNFNFNYRLTWPDRQGPNYWTAWTKFHLARLLSLTFNQALFAVFTLLGVHYLLVSFVLLIVITAFNYLSSDLFVFQAKKISRE